MNATLDDQFDLEHKAALVVVADDAAARLVAESLSGLGYRVSVGFSTEDVCLKLRSHPYEVVVLGAKSGEGIDAGEVYREAMRIQPDQRRKQFFVLVGADYATGDAMQAFAFSVDQVFNLRDLGHFASGLRYGQQQREEIFGMFLDCRQNLDITFL